jgi:hypothetical protein
MKQVRFANVVAYVFEFEMFQPFFPRFFQTTILSNNSRDERAENESRQAGAAFTSQELSKKKRRQKATATVGDYDVDICNNDNDHIIGNDRVHVNDDVDNNIDIDDIDDDGSINIDDRC